MFLVDAGRSPVTLMNKGASVLVRTGRLSAAGLSRSPERTVRIVLCSMANVEGVRGAAADLWLRFRTSML
jgi:hypothetical protein